MYLSHINVTMPKHSEAIARMFYSELLGFSAFASKFTHREDCVSEGCHVLPFPKNESSRAAHSWTFSSARGRFTCIQHFQCANGGGTAGLDAEFFEYFLHMLFHGGLGDAENRGYVRVRLALGQPEQRLGCARCQAEL